MVKEILILISAFLLGIMSALMVIALTRLREIMLRLGYTQKRYLSSLKRKREHPKKQFLSFVVAELYEKRKYYNKILYGCCIAIAILGFLIVFIEFFFSDPFVTWEAFYGQTIAILGIILPFLYHLNNRIDGLYAILPRRKR